MAEAKPPPKREEKAPPKEYYEKVSKESKAALLGSIPSIALGITAAVLVWLFGRLIFIPISQGIEWYGTSLRGFPPETITPNSLVLRTYKKEVKTVATRVLGIVITRKARESGREGLSIHGFRAYFQSMLESAGVNPNWIKTMMRHSLGQVQGSYSQSDELMKTLQRGLSLPKCFLSVRQ